MDHIRHALLLMAAVLLGACANPAAQKPSNPDVLAILDRNAGFVNVGPNRNGAFEILPGALPSGGFQLYFLAPYPTSHRVLLDGQVLPRFEDLPAGTDTTASGYFKVRDVRVNTTPARWNLIIVPPAAKLASRQYDVQVINLSNNTSFPPGSRERESEPLVLQMVAQRVYLLTVVKAGGGSGRIASADRSIDCGINCDASYTQSQTITLTPRSDQGARFSGWGVSCSSPNICNCPATASTCTVTLNGTPVVVTANFSLQSTPPDPLQTCPGPRSEPNLSFRGSPDCPQPATRGCDANGYFCCTPSGAGGVSARCGVDKREFQASCQHIASIPSAGPAPTPPFDGCYTRN